MELAANGGVISYESVGNGAPFVLCHGGEADARMFFKLVPLLSDAFTVITYDQRDTGGTKFPAVPYTMADHADDVAALISALGYERAHVLGTSYGGMIAQEVALRRPDRVDHLILSVTTRGIGQPLTPAAVRAISARLETGGDENRGEGNFNELMFSPGAIEREPDLLDDLDRILIERTSEGTARRMAATQQFMGDATVGRLSALRAPTLVVSGFGDQMVRAEESWELAREIPRATLVVLEGAGHLWPLEAPQAGARYIEAFLGGTR